MHPQHAAVSTQSFTVGLDGFDLSAKCWDAFEDFLDVGFRNVVAEAGADDHPRRRSEKGTETRVGIDHPKLAADATEAGGGMADDLIQKGGLLPQLQLAALAGIDQYERIAMCEELAHGQQNAERGTRKGDMGVHAMPHCGRDQGGYRNQHQAQQGHRDLQ